MDHEDVNKTAHLKRDRDAANTTNVPQPFSSAAVVQHAPAQKKKMVVAATSGQPPASSLMAALQVEQQDETLMEGRHEVWHQQ